LVAPKGLNTRPTPDMAKEGLFNIISEHVPGAVVLDLFCGSGAIGLEALSRGGLAAVFVDSSRHAIEALAQNIEKTKLVQFCTVMQISMAKAIHKLSIDGHRFDIIFLDPPYETDLLRQTLESLAATDLLADNGLIIAETDSKFGESVPEVKAFTLTDTRCYGRTCFLFYRKACL